MRFQYIQLFTIFSILLLNSYAIGASSCKTILSPSYETEIVISIPGKGNQFTKRAFENLNSSQQNLLKALNSAVSILEHPDIIEALQSINQPISALNTEEHTYVFPAQLIDAAKNTANRDVYFENYIFFTETLDGSFSQEALIGLSILFSNVDRRPKLTSGIVFQSTAALMQTPSGKRRVQKENEAEQKLLNSRRFSRPLYNLLKTEAFKVQLDRKIKVVQEDSLRLMIERELLRNPSMDPATTAQQLRTKIAKHMHTVDDIISHFERTGRFKKVHSVNVGLSMEVLSNLFEEHFNWIKPQSLPLQDYSNLAVSTLASISRAERLIIFESFLADYLGARADFSAISNLADHTIFRAAIPHTSDEISKMINNNLKSILAPIRNAVSQMRVERREAESNQSPTQARSIFTFTESDFSTPRVEALNSQGLKRPRRNRNQRTDDTQTLEANTAKSIEWKYDLLRFTDFTNESERRSVKDLQKDVVYSLRFLRESDQAQIRNVSFTESVIKSFLDNPVIASKMLRALSLGPAARSKQDGLKKLQRINGGKNGSLYELKLVVSDTRAVVRHLNGQWQLLEITNKKNLDRIAEKFQ